MRFLKKLFSSKEEQIQTNHSSDSLLTEQEKKQTELSKKFSSIFPYFKQLLFDNSTPESLPNDLSNIDKTKTYSVPGLNLIIKNICDDLNCLYVYDTETGLEIIQASELTKLNISKEELHEIAMANFRQLISKRLKVQNNGEYFWFILDGNLEAGLVLVDEIWDQVEGNLKEDIVICVPSRDIIVATGKSNSKVIADFTEKAKQILNGGDHPLSKNWFIRENKTWKVFKRIIN
jgi:uncharacterized protein YtpQ (UPF0354 family)